MSRIGNETLTNIGSIVALLAVIFLLGCSGGGGGGGDGGGGDTIIEEDGPTVITLEDGGSITIPINALPANIQIDVVETAIPILPEGFEAIGTAYFIDVDANLNLPATIKLPEPEGEQPGDLAIIRMEESGKISILQTNVENGQLIARTPGFSIITPARLKGLLKNLKPKIIGPEIIPPDTNAQYFESQFVEIPGLNRQWRTYGYGIAQQDIDLTTTDEPLKNNCVTLRTPPNAEGTVDLMIDLIEPSTGVNVVALKNIIIQDSNATGSTDLDINIISPLIVEKNESFIVGANLLNLGDDSGVLWSWELEGGNSGTAEGPILLTSPQQLNESGIHTLTVSATTAERDGNATLDIVVIGGLTITSLDIDPGTLSEYLYLAETTATANVLGGFPPYTYTWTLLPEEHLQSKENTSFENEDVVTFLSDQPGWYVLKLTVVDALDQKDEMHRVIQVGPMEKMDITVENLPAEEEANKQIDSFVKVKGGRLVWYGKKYDYYVAVKWDTNQETEKKLLHADSPSDWHEITLSHTYPEAGDYNISIVAFPAWMEKVGLGFLSYLDDISPMVEHPIKIVNANIDDLEVTISVDNETPAVNDPVNFTTTVSGGQAPYTFQWDFDNDGTIDSNNSNPGHTFTAAGTYTVTLTVTDSANNEDTASLDINVTEYTTLDSCPMVYDASLDNDGNTTYIYLIHETYSDGGYKDYTRCRYHSLEYLQRETQYVNGLMNGPDKHFTASGFLEWDTPYVDDIKHGLEKKYYYDFEQLEQETPYVNGIIHGVVNEYRITGELERETPYVDGEKTGLSIFYFISGQIAQETPFVDGEREGLHKSYYESGQLRIETPYIEGIRHGLIKEYYESGQLARETPYNNGIVHGNKKEYDLDGQLISCMIYENGIHVGSCMP